MKNLDSYFINIINKALSFIQNKLSFIKENSLFLTKIDYFILFFVILTYITSTFGQTNLIGAVSFFVPLLIVIKVLITKGEKIELEKCNLFFWIYLFLCILSVFTSSMPKESLYGLMKTLMYAGFYFALCQFLKTNKKYIPILLYVIAVLISIEGVIGIIQNSMHLQNISTWQDVSYLNPEDVLSRVYGTLKPYNPNLLGGYMVCGITSLFGISALALIQKYYKTAAAVLIISLISSFTIFLSGCRGAYIALFVIFLGIIAASGHIIYNNYENLKSMWIKALSLIITGAAAFMLINHKILQRLMSIFILRGDSSTSFRMNVYNSSLKMFHDNWLFGIGTGNKVFREIYGLYMLSGFDALSCYCIFLEIAVESGIFALIAYLLYIICVIKSGIKTFIKENNISNKIIVIIPVISIIAVMIHGLVDTIYFRPQVQYLFWTMAAIITVLSKEEKEEAAE